MKFDICSVGSALVDFTFNIDKEYEKSLINYGIPKGSMTLIEREEQEALIKELIEMGKTPDKACGGSGTNSTVAASLFGAKCHMTCIVADDDHGRFYIEDLSSNNVNHTNPPISSDLSSGKCLVMVSDDAERTMCTNLGISTEFWTSDLDEKIIKDSRYLFLEGYLVASPKGMEICKKAIKAAKESDTKVSISLSDPNIVHAFKDEIKSLLDMECDLIFCNEDEALAFAETEDLSEAFQVFKGLSPNFLITQGSSGCIGFDGKDEFNIPGIKVKAIDSNGAGDMFAGAVLFCITSELSLEKGAIFGCYAASKVVGNVGPRLIKDEYLKIKNNFF
jgi:sugar/nucleoside kinase (ribokinase family)